MSIDIPQILPEEVWRIVKEFMLDDLKRNYVFAIIDINPKGFPVYYPDKFKLKLSIYYQIKFKFKPYIISWMKKECAELERILVEYYIRNEEEDPVYYHRFLVQRRICLERSIDKFTTCLSDNRFVEMDLDTFWLTIDDTCKEFTKYFTTTVRSQTDLYLEKILSKPLIKI